MTALNAFVCAEHVVIVMDTLALGAETLKPAFFCTKYVVLPHLDGVICGTGNFRFIAAWQLRVQTAIHATDMRVLNLYAPEVLRGLRSEFLDPSTTATLYHFGFVSQTNRYHVYVYRSTSDFESEELPGEGLILKPEIEPTPEIRELPTDLVRVTLRQRQIDDALPSRDRIGIGGQIHSVHLQPGAITASTVCSFVDYCSTYNALLEIPQVLDECGDGA